MNTEVKALVVNESVNQNAEQRRGEKDSSLMSYWPAFVAILTGVWYVQGYLYARGHADGYGVELSLFGLQQQDYFIYTFIAYVSLFTKLLPLQGALMWFAGFVGLVVFVLLTAGFTMGRLAFSDGLRKKIAEVRRSETANSLFKNGVLGAATSLGMLYLVYFVALFLFFLMWPYGMGISAATEDKAKFQSCQAAEKPSNQYCSYLIEEKNNSISGRLLADSEGATLIYDGKGVHVIRKDGDRLFITNSPVNKPTKTAPDTAPEKHVN